MKNFPRFFTRQLLGFVALAFLIIVVDFMLYAAFAIREMDGIYNEDTPSLAMAEVDSQLSKTASGAYVLGEAGMAMLEESGAWAILISLEGDVIWNHKTPPEVPRAYSIGDVALFSHYGYLEDYPTFIWERDDGLLVLGFPKGSYSVFAKTSFPRDMIANIPLYVLIVLFVDLLIFFAAYMLSKRRTVNSISPISDALVELSMGKDVSLNLKGDLRDIGERINETSAIIKKKDSARDNWVRGISHDIRTPLSVITGYADSIAKDGNLPEKTRDDAALIRAQGMKIKDLVLDLNAASRLEYDMQPLQVDKVPMARMLREVIADYLNGGLPKQCMIDLDIVDDARDLAVVGDERLLKRAVQNLVQNSVNHNPQGCSIRIALFLRKDGSVEQGCLLVSDTGKGMDQTRLAELHERLYQARIHADGSSGVRGDDSGLDTFHGLGLVLVEKIIRAHGGVMKISSVEGQGFATEMYLPMQHLALSLSHPAGFYAPPRGRLAPMREDLTPEPMIRTSHRRSDADGDSG